MLWQRHPDWLGAAIDDAVVMLDVESGSYFGLNRTAGLIWEALAEPTTPQAIVDRLTAQFDVSAEHCAQAVGRTLQRLGEVGAARQIGD